LDETSIRQVYADSTPQNSGVFLICALRLAARPREFGKILFKKFLTTQCIVAVIVMF